MKIRSLIIGISLFGLGFSTLSYAQSNEQLRQDVALLKSSNENANAKLADAMNRLTALEQEVASMKGVTESGGHFYEEQTKALRDYDQRLAAMEDKITTLTTLLKEIKDSRSASTDKPSATTEGGPNQEFQRLLDYVNTEDWNQALSGFQGFIRKYPKSPLAENAQFWIAESYYGLGNYKKAIGEYQILIQKYPRSSKVKTALLKQGYSFASLNMNSDAKPFLEKVTRDYPNTPEAAKASAKIKELGKAPVANATPAPSPETPPPPAVAPEANPVPNVSTTTNPSPAPSTTSPVPQSPPANRHIPSSGLYD